MSSSASSWLAVWSFSRVAIIVSENPKRAEICSAARASRAMGGQAAREMAMIAFLPFRPFGSGGEAGEPLGGFALAPEFGLAAGSGFLVTRRQGDQTREERLVAVEGLARGVAAIAGKGGFSLGGAEPFGLGAGPFEGGLRRGERLGPRGGSGRVGQLLETSGDAAAGAQGISEPLDFTAEFLFPLGEAVAFGDGVGIRAAGLGAAGGGDEPTEFPFGERHDLGHAAAAGHRLDLALDRGQEVFADALLLFLLALAAPFDTGDPLADPEEPGGAADAAAHQFADEALRLVGLVEDAAGTEIGDAGVAAAIEALGDAEPTGVGLDVGFHQRAAARIGAEELDRAGHAGMGLEEQRVEGVEAGGLAVLVAGAKDVYTLGHAFDGDAAIAEAADIVEAERGELHGRPSSVLQ